MGYENNAAWGWKASVYERIDGGGQTQVPSGAVAGYYNILSPVVVDEFRVYVCHLIYSRREQEPGRSVVQRHADWEVGSSAKFVSNDTVGDCIAQHEGPSVHVEDYFTAIGKRRRRIIVPASSLWPEPLPSSSQRIRGV
eukprot:CAMPEP_0118631890 /NCGR_PEP_ID=MMETSP0785-20121206/146_1 /TAXON_ID=91992 /ORGANISM="Bolidomonas pacifica, Strain CCMP 1866" /LENGTH=138 /DNA_ID=CAMNT_0006522611 /DNA_START=332 /DNA_END=749 /DNA_ORIENTATION=+